MIDERENIRQYGQGHFIDRLMERFGLTISQEECEDMIEKIENYDYYPLRVEDSGRSFHPVTISNQEVIVLYDWEFKSLITAFYPSWFKQNEKGEWVKSHKKSSKFLRKKFQKQARREKNYAQKERLAKSREY